MTHHTRTVLVIGATGNIGRHVVAGLLDRGIAVRALSRHPEPAAARLPRGIEVVAGDLTAPGSLTAALAGVDAVFLLWPFMRADGAPAVAAALAEHAAHVVYVSAMSAEHNNVWGQVEHAVRQSGTGWTFLRPGGFATNTLEWAAAIRADEEVRIPYARAARSLIHERDIADVAVLTLAEPGHEGATYALTGPATLTQEEQVRTIGRAIDRTVRPVEISAAEARERMTAEWGDPAFADQALAYWASLVDTPEPVTGTVEAVTGRPARTFAEWARDHADDFRPLTPAEIAERYVAAFRAGRMDLALRFMAPDVVRTAPLETAGDRTELRGLDTIMANAQRLNADLEITGVEVDGPFLGGDRFAVRFTFAETHVPTGRRLTTTKLSLYTVTGGTISREEVFYFDPHASLIALSRSR